MFPPIQRLYVYFYPRSPCGERPQQRGCFTSQLLISIHALLAESDAPAPAQLEAVDKFLSTLSLRRATVPACCSSRWRNYFYPRSPCGERLGRGCFTVQPRYFYPRSPCGERRSPRTVSFFTSLFLSTLSLRRATRAARCTWRS